MKNLINAVYISVTLLLVMIIGSGCKKYLEIPLPIDQLASETVFTTRSTIQSAVNGMYSIHANGTLKGNYYRMTYWLSDEGEINPLPGSEVGDLIAANIVPANSSLVLWSWFYSGIFRANDILERLPAVPSTIMPEEEKRQLLAAAKYVRAAEHFLLTTAWGDVPLITSTSAQENVSKPRTPQAEVYAAIVRDLQESAADLPVAAVVNNQRVIHNRYQPMALLSKVYLYMGRWEDAARMADSVILSNQFQIVTGVNNVFRRGSRETIFAHGPAAQGLLFDNRTVLGWLTQPATVGNATTNYVAMPAALLNAFQTGDQRRVNGNWTVNLFNRTFANKYLYSSAASAATIAAAPQDFIFQRLAEIYLIRAEARAQLGRVTGANSAATDLNLIRTRAGLPATTATTQAAMLTAIERERQCELFYEGHRWFDLKRTGRLQAVLSAVPYKASNYKSHYDLWPISLNELIVSPNLTQNPGY